MSLPPLGISQSLKNSQIFLKDQNLASLLCSFPPCILLFKLLRLFNTFFIVYLDLPVVSSDPSSHFVQIRLEKGSLTLTLHLAPTSLLARVSEFLLSAKLVLSLEEEKRLVERADNAASACLRDRFPSRFLLSAMRVDASLSG